MSIETLPLFRFVSERDKRLVGALFTLREQLEGLLRYTVETFPHYTSHAIDHSDEVISQLSRLLFADNGDLIIPDLSTLEGYVLIAAAYLHDAGMVVSEKEKQQLLSSPDWTEWLHRTGRFPEWETLLAQRTAGDGNHFTGQTYLADLKLRYFLAEYYRSQHHLRSLRLTHDLKSGLSDFDFGNPQLRNTIADICLAHGLRSDELDDAVRFPFRCDIWDQTINVRLCAIVLRLADLLDMRTERACPLLQGAASPLPSDSYPHWTQYSRIVNKSTTPEEIRIHAECQTSTEYALLQDWCGWITTEVANAPSLLAHSTRHSSWRAPAATMGLHSATIQIVEAPDATFIPCKWRFELEPDAVFDRLIRDAYSYQLQYVRELLQNALDAMRCKMYDDMRGEGLVTPPYPFEVTTDIRDKYSLKVALASEVSLDEVTGEERIVQLLSIDDCGIGMDKDTITRFLLQVGRSYYQTHQFRQEYNFAPGSRFGVGFLSVFAASEHVLIETFRPSSKDGPLKMHLTRPKAFLILERGTRAHSGTRIVLRLSVPLPQGKLTEEILRLCKRVEFPIVIDDMGIATTVSEERPEMFEFSPLALTGRPETTIECRAYPFDIGGTKGENYVFVARDANGEDWTRYQSFYGLHAEYPPAMLPAFPTELLAFHGLTVTDREIDRLGSGHGYASRLDVRNKESTVALGRDKVTVSSLVKDALDRKRFELIEHHLAESGRGTGPKSWRYKQRLMSTFGFSASWIAAPGTARAFYQDYEHLVALKWLMEQEELVTALMVRRWARSFYRAFDDQEYEPPKELISNQAPTLWHFDFTHFNDTFVTNMMQNRVASSVKKVAIGRGEALLIGWRLAPVPIRDDRFARKMHPIDFGEPADLGLSYYSRSFNFRMLNSGNPLIDWWLRLSDSDVAKEITPKLRKGFTDALVRQIAIESSYTNVPEQTAEHIARLLDLPANLHPPT